jgi:hypothetical protein
MIRNAVFVCCVASLSASCSYVERGRVAQPEVLAGAKSVYVVRENPSNEIGLHLESAFADRGLKVSSGPMTLKKKEADLYVEYVDRWTWDITMYLTSLDVTVKDNRNGEFVASGNFHQSLAHTYPNTAQKSREVVNAIYVAGAR